MGPGDPPPRSLLAVPANSALYVRPMNGTAHALPLHRLHSYLATDVKMLPNNGRADGGDSVGCGFAASWTTGIRSVDSELGLRVPSSPCALDAVHCLHGSRWCILGKTLIVVVGAHAAY